MERTQVKVYNKSQLHGTADSDAKMNQLKIKVQESSREPMGKDAANYLTE